jgi:broad specificity phosphatase PhoE
VPSLAGVVLARHGETPYNAEGRFQGQSDVGLSARGREQAAELAREAAARSWGAFWCSPLARARETAAAVAAAIGAQPTVDARLAETDCGAWTHRTFDEVEAEAPDLFAAFGRTEAGFRFPEGESFDEQQRRVAACLAEVHATGPLPALVVCHRNVIRLALVSLTGDDGWRTRPIPNAGLVELP